jgi:hypothetical protein
MSRQTADGITIDLWDDGAVTGALGYRLRGVPVRRPLTPEAQHRARTAGLLLLGEVCLWKREDVPDLYRAAERAARLDGLPGTVRRLMRETRNAPPAIALHWTVVAADRNGRPLERVCRLPRLWWPGYVVFDFCGSVGSARGRYVLMEDKQRNGTCTQTGFAFGTLRDLRAHLTAIREGA